MRCLDPGCPYGENPAGAFVCRCGLLLPGGLLGGRYRIERLVGRGMVSVVYAARDLRLKRVVALKALLASANDLARARFLNEAELAAALDHANILAVLDFGQDGPIAYLIMPLLTGGTLEDVMLQHQGPLPPPLAARYFRQLAAALDYAHTHPRHILHRDVKPANILIHPGDGRLLLADFSIARALEADRRLTAVGLTLGTPNYAAPEQMRGQAIPASDQYAAAVVLFQMLTGRLPFTAPTVTEQVQQHLSQPPPPPSSLNRALPKEIDAVLLRALAKDADKRFPNVTACADALMAALALTPMPPQASAPPVVPGAVAPVQPGEERPPLPAGKLLRSGRYLIIRPLRSEAVGELYLIHEQAHLDKQRVLLRLADQSAGGRTAQRVSEFLQVTQVLLALEHPAIPRFYEQFQEGKETYFLLEYLHAESLKTRLAHAGKALPEAEVLSAASRMLDALTALGQGAPAIVHRNIKPGNILRTFKGGHFSLVGFDAAVAITPPPSGGKPRIEPRGTRGYFPPEQATRDRVPDLRWDLYGLGATMHHLLTNRDPQTEALFDFPSARSLNPALSPEVEQILLRATARDANSRYHTAIDMKRDIDRLLTPTCQRCGAPVRPQARFCGRCGAKLAPKSAQ